MAMDVVNLAQGLRAAMQAVDAGPFLDDWPPLVASRAVPATWLPVCDCLPQLASQAAGTLSPLVAGLMAGARGMDWRQTYGAADFGAEFLQGYGWTELIGLRGPIPSTQVAVGFLLLGPGITYPPHAHEAVELYLPLSGTALWQQGAGAFAPVPPGTPIRHDTWVPHAMQTGDQPLLAAYVWRGGDLAAKSQIVG
jgi:hypothetical protein